MDEQYEDCAACAKIDRLGVAELDWPPGAYRRLVEETGFGHDPVAHRVYGSFMREGVSTAVQVARLSDVELGDMRNLGLRALERVRSRFPGPTPAPVVTAQERHAAQIREHEDLLGCIWLYIDWPRVTRRLTTEQKELFADSVDAWCARIAEMDGRAEPSSRADRWWR